MTASWKRYGPLIEPGARRRWLALVCLAVVVSGIEALAALCVFFVLGSVTNPSGPLKVPGIGDLRQRFPHASDGQIFVGIALVLGVFFLVRAGINIVQSYVQYRVVNQTGARLSTRLLNGYLSQPYAWHLHRNSSELIRTAYDSVLSTVANVFVPLVAVASEALIVVSVTTVLLVKAPVATLLAAVLLGPMIYILLRVLQPRMVWQGKVNEDMSQRSLQVMQQSLGGIRDVKLLRARDYFVKQLADTRGTQARALGLRATFYDLPRVIVETFAILFILAFLAVNQVHRVSTHDSFAVLGLFAYAVLRIMPSLHRIVTFVNLVKFGSTAVDNVNEGLALGAPTALSDPTPSAPFTFQQDIVVEGVSYRYEATDIDVLQNVSLVVHQGQSVGIVGPTGGGKTTLVDVMLGLISPSAGRVSVDGIDIVDVVEGWQSLLGVVPQAPFLLDDTLRRNIAFGLDDAGIDEKAVLEAVQLSQLDEFVASLADGLDTTVGERGVRVSGGQRQRVAIARALYRRPAVIVFDEGTSALDNVTEAELIRALEWLRGDRTVITIAHRLTTVRSCDQIVLLSDGQVRDLGTYDELLERNAEFRQMVG